MRWLTISSTSVSPVSSLKNTAIGTPQARWRDSTQSGRSAIIERSRFWPGGRIERRRIDRGERAGAQRVAGFAADVAGPCRRTTAACCGR